MRCIISCLGAFLLLIWPNLSLAQDTSPPAKPKIEKTVPPLLITVVTPKYPADLRRRRIEGWVRLSGTVETDGSVTNIQVVDGFKTKEFRSRAIKALASARYKPATENGTPIRWERTQINVPFLLENPFMLYPSPMFMAAYKKVDVLLKKNDYDGARKQIEFALTHRRVRTLTEFGMLEERLYRTELGAKRTQAALTAIQRAVWVLGFPRQKSISPEFFPALQEQFVFLVALHRYAEADAARQTLDKFPWLKPNDEFKSYLSQLQAAKKSDEPITVPAMIEDGSWSYVPLRRTLTVTALKGRIDRLKAECNRKAATIEFQPDVEWTLPASWGGCRIAFEGSEGTSFTVVEFKQPNLAKDGSQQP